MAVLIGALTGSIDPATKTTLLRELGEVPGYDLPRAMIVGSPVICAETGCSPIATLKRLWLQDGRSDDPAFKAW